MQKRPSPTRSFVVKMDLSLERYCPFSEGTGRKITLNSLGYGALFYCLSLSVAIFSISFDHLCNTNQRHKLKNDKNLALVFWKNNLPIEVLVEDISIIKVHNGV